MSATTEGFGIDIGGTGIKGARVDLTTGELLSERHRLPTPSPSTAEAVADIVAKIVNNNGYTGEVGITFPAVIQHGIAHTAANVDKSWVDADVRKIMSQQLPAGAEIINDADAAGIAELRFGAGKDQKGTVLLLTFGTGIGSALFTNGHLVPNTEFGHIELGGNDAEKYAAASIKDAEDLSYKHWAKRVSKYLQTLEKGLWPDLIIAGGGVSKKAEKWIPHLECRTPVVPAKLLNNAGIVGAALAAYENRGE